MLEDFKVTFRSRPSARAASFRSAAEDLADIDAYEFPQESHPVDLGNFCRLITGAKEAGRKLLCMLDINQTLGVFQEDSFKFYRDENGRCVGDLLVKAALSGPIVLITGDQKSAIENKFLPAVEESLESFASTDRIKALSNLTIYTNTGNNVVSWDKNGRRVNGVYEWALLKPEEIEVIKEKIVSPLIERHKNDPSFELLKHNGFSEPSSSLQESLSSPERPFFTQVDPNDPSSIEFSIFGIHAGDRRFHLRRLLAKSPSLREFVDRLIDECRQGLVDNGIRRISAQQGGISTIDFRVMDKGSVGFLYVAKSMNEYLERGEDGAKLFADYFIVGIGDSFGPNGNDRSLNKVCNATLDVSTGLPHKQNILIALSSIAVEGF